MNSLFDLTGRVAVVTGGAGLLGVQHANAIASAGGIPVLADRDGARALSAASEIRSRWGVDAIGIEVDVTRVEDVRRLLAATLDRYGRVDILINNAANNPKVEASGLERTSRLETFPQEHWDNDLRVGLTGAFLCSQALGTEMARRGRGVILNVASDLALIAPDQRIYRQPGLAEEQQPVKPVSYTVVKAGLIGLTRYLATYWAGSGVRVNAVSPGGVRTDQDAEFVARLSALIPLGRMASIDEYRGAIIFLCSDASSYMTGGNLVVDGGRTAW